MSRAEVVERPSIEGRPVRIDVAIPATLPPVRGVASEVRRVFVNLLINARDAMSRGGVISVRAWRERGRVKVEVADEGTGIAPRDLPRLFDPFFTTKGEAGTGLGLSIAWSVMERLGGGIEARNRRDRRGAAFTLSFPVARARRKEAAASAPAPAATARARRVLVVDDDPDNLEAIQTLLKHEGVEVGVMPDGETALAALAGPEGDAIDVVLCDVGMPGMDGWEVARRIRALRPGLRVVLLTGWAREIAPDDRRLALVDGVLEKPVEIDRLLGALGRRRADDARATSGAKRELAVEAPPR
jgi:CheY-like chemotaxis protein